MLNRVLLGVISSQRAGADETPIPDPVELIIVGSDQRRFTIPDFSSLPNPTPSTGITNLNTVDYSPDGTYLAIAPSGPGSINLYDASTGVRTAAYSSSIAPSGLSYSPTGGELAYCSFSSPYLRRLNTPAMTEIPASGASAGAACYSVRYSPDGTYLAICTSGSGNRLKIYRVSDMSILYTANIGVTAGRGLAWAPDSSEIAVATSGGFHVFNFPSMTGRTVLASGLTGCRSVDYSPDGQTIAVSTGGSPYLTLVNAVTLDAIPAVPSPPTSEPYAVRFSRNGKYLGLCEGALPRIRVYLTATWAQLSDPATPVGFDGRGFAFRPG